MKTRKTAAALFAAAALMAGGQAAAQWPERPVTLIVPFPAGGGTVGAGVAAKARPDGYTFFMGGAHHALAPSLYKSLNYNIQKDFVPVALVAQPPQVVVINASKLPVKTLQEFIDYAKKRPGDINFGTAGKGSTHHLAGELFAMQTGIKLVDVPYQGAGPMLSALIGGQVDLAFDGLGSSSNHIRSGTIKPLAVAASERSPSLPDVPTAAEAGVPNYVVSTWYAIWAPAGTPKEAVDRMTAEITKALNTPKIKEIWTSNGSAIPGMTGADFGQFVDSEVARWAKVVRDSGVQLD